MPSKPLLLIDQDGVLADFDQGVRLAWRAQYHSEAPIGSRQHFYLRDDMAPQYHQQLHDIYTRPGFFATLPPIAGAVEALHTLLAHGLDVHICTAPISDYQNCVAEKFMWVEQHLGREWVSRIILTKDKTWVRGDILIDDKPQISGSLAPLWTQWLYDAPYNRQYHDRRRVCWQDSASWADLLA